ncbi:MAG: hypothetical protein RLZZ612_2031 [Pseudomonadota bacterium]
MSRCMSTYRLRRSRGFVLIYVLGAVLLLSAVVMGASLSVREQMASVAARKQQLQAEQSLKGALHTATAKIALDIEVARRKPNDTQLAQALSPRYAPWTASWTNQELVQADQTYAVQVIPAEWLPDANLLVLDDWRRLFEGLGVPSEQAQGEAQKILMKRNLLMRMGSSRGFTHWDQLISALSLSPVPIYGRTDQSQQGLLDLLVLGTGKRSTDPNQTPLPIYRALYNANEDRLNRLMRLRSAGPVTAAQEAEVLGLRPSSTVNQAATNAAANVPRLFRLVVTSQSAGPQSMTMTALVSVQAGQVSILQEYLFYKL